MQDLTPRKVKPDPPAADIPHMGYVDHRLIGHWERVRTERDEERRFLTQMLREQTGRTPSLDEVSTQLARFRDRLDSERLSLRWGSGPRTPNPGDFD